MGELFSKAMAQEITGFLQEDDLSRNHYYLQQLPQRTVKCHLKWKDDLVIAGLPYFYETFRQLGAQELSYLVFSALEGHEKLKANAEETTFTLPFSIALMGERLALNLLQHCCAIATLTRKFVAKASPLGIKILDTRKTTPGLRGLEKYAVRVGGGYNHRFGQSDVWMVKDNHKRIFGGIRPAIEFFMSLQTFYVPLVVEIHSLDELQEAIALNIRHVMLDNFTPQQVRQALTVKSQQMTVELSGGIRLENLAEYLIPGVDAISVGALTSNAPQVDISLKFS